MWPNPQETAELATFIEEIFNGKLHFLCIVVELSLSDFTNACDYSYGKASYLCLVDENGRIHCGYAIEKSWVAFLKYIIAPRMEVVNATLLIKTSALLKKNYSLFVRKKYFEQIENSLWAASGMNTENSTFPLLTGLSWLGNILKWKVIWREHERQSCWLCFQKQPPEELETTACNFFKNVTLAEHLWVIASVLPVALIWAAKTKLKEGF